MLKQLENQQRRNINSPLKGNGGNLTIETGHLNVRDGAQVSVRADGQGDAGTLRIDANESVEVIGTSADGQSISKLTGAVGSGATGSGGDVSIETGQLLVQDGAEATVSSQGPGNAGNLEFMAGSIRLDNQATVSANTTAGQGNIILNSEDLVLRRDSNITTDAKGIATGGNITIDTDLLVALENSDISANAEEASGGRVRISSQGIFGTEFRAEETLQSDITATSELGPQFSGTVDISTPDVDPSKGLVALPEEVVDASGLIAQGCEGPSASRFTVTGRGGLPPNPDETPIADDVLAGLVTLDSSSKTRSNSVNSTPSSRKTPSAFVEARGWVVNKQGEVTLTAEAPNPTACDSR